MLLKSTHHYVSWRIIILSHSTLSFWLYPSYLFVIPYPTSSSFYCAYAEPPFERKTLLAIGALTRWVSACWRPVLGSPLLYSGPVTPVLPDCVYRRGAPGYTAGASEHQIPSFTVFLQHSWRTYYIHSVSLTRISSCMNECCMYRFSDVVVFAYT